MTLKMTPQMKTVFHPIKKQIIAILKPAVVKEFGYFVSPPHKVVMRTSEDFASTPEPDAEPDELVAYAMRNNPYISVEFTPLSRQAPDAVNYETLREMVDELHSLGFVPDDVQVAFSPYNLSAKSKAGTQRIVFIFDEAVYGSADAEPVPSVSAVPPPPVVGHRPNPMDYLT